MDITKDVQRITTFRNHAAEIMRHLLDLAAEEGLRQGEEDDLNGRVRPAKEVFDEMRTAFGIPR